MAIRLIPQACPLCGSESSGPVADVKDVTYRIPGEFRIVRCRDCGHQYLNPRPTNETLMEAYPSSYAPHAELAAAKAGTREDYSRVEPSGSTVRRFLRQIPGARAFLNWLGQENATWIGEPPDSGRSRLLEIGCAHGGYLEEAMARGWQVEGIEPSREAADRAQAKGLSVRCGYLQDFSMQDEEFACVALWMVLEHVPEPRVMLQRIARLLQPNGVLAFSVPNRDTWEPWLFGRHWLGYDPPRHLQIFSARQLRRVLEEEGFQDVRVVHQSNTRYWWGSLAAWGRQAFPKHTWPQRWMEYFKTEPPLWWKWLFLLPGKVNACLRCSGRVTVIARRDASA